MKAENIEDSYPLSPMQQGMLFHTLYAQQSGVDIEQVICALHENLNAVAFERAWQRVVEQHPVLRTSFRWEGLDEPLQQVHHQVRLPLEQQDWRGLSARERENRLHAYLQADRRRGFQLTEVPPMRLALFRVAEADYQFIWTFHHALLDGRSFPIVLKEVFTLYEAFCQVQDLELKRPHPYRDYIAWLLQQDPSKAEAFWRQALKGFTAPTPLVVAQAPGGMLGKEEGYGVQQIWLSVAIRSALQSLAQQHQLTLNTLVQGAWALLLSRYSGEEDVVFGATRACRRSTLEGAELMVGLFINTLPVRARVSPEISLLPWLKELRAQQIAVREYEHTPLVKVQQWSDVPRGVPLFESLLVFERYRMNTVLRAQGGSWENREFRVLEQANYPLTVVAYSEPELLLKIEYDRCRFDDAIIYRMLKHFQTLLEGIVAHPGGRLSDLPLLTEAERQQLLVEWNGTKADYPKDKCIHQLFEAQVERTPEAIAVVFEDQQLTYSELNARANQLAHYLRKQGVGPEVLVGIYMERSLEMVVGLLGILKAGGAYVPLDLTYPKERLAFMLEDTQVPVLLTQERLVSGLPQHGATVVCLDADWEVIAQESEESLVSGATAENLAYVIYTSGSTGRPKGVEIQHAGLVNLATWHQRVYSVRPVDRATQVASPAFDATVWELWPYLTAGASIHIPDEETCASESKLLEWLAGESITLCFLPTPLAETVLEEHWPIGLVLRALLTGGDKLHRRPQKTLPFCLMNHYGPTENTVVTTCAPVTTGTETTSPPIGRPIANTRTYLLDSHLQIVPVGVPGELHISGDGLALGYLNRPELTAEKFIPNPFSEEPGERLYKTGDLARYLPDSNIEFLGRIDHQVKVSGFRIELGEIEAVLGGHPAVHEVVVMAREDVPGDKRLVAYVVPVQGQAPAAIELRHFLKERLPEYMVPSAFVMLDMLPLTPNGKVDRRALPKPDGLHAETNESYVAPHTPMEKFIAEIWQEVLGVDRVSVHDNFFDLGGHSLLSIKVISRIEKKIGQRIDPREIILQTLGQLAAICEQQMLSAQESQPKRLTQGLFDAIKGVLSRS